MCVINEIKRKNKAPPQGWPRFKPMKKKEGQIDEWEECEPLPPLFVYFDIEARQDQGEHVAKSLKERLASKNFWIGCANKTKTDDPEEETSDRRGP